MVLNEPLLHTVWLYSRLKAALRSLSPLCCALLLDVICLIHVISSNHPINGTTSARPSTWKVLLFLRVGGLVLVGWLRLLLRLGLRLCQLGRLRMLHVPWT